MLELSIPLNDYEIAHKALFLSEAAQQLYYHPMTASEYEALPDQYRLSDEIFARYHTVEAEGAYYSYLPLGTYQEERFAVMYRPSRYAFPYLHRHNCFEVFYVYSGRCRHYVDGKLKILEEGDFCIIGPDTVHAIEMLQDEDIVFLFLISQEAFNASFLSLFRKNPRLLEFFDAILNKKQYGSYILYSTGKDTWMHELVYHMYRDNLERDYLMQASISSQLCQIFIHLLRNYEMEATIESPQESKPERRFVELIHYLTDHYNSTTLQETAEHFGYSEVYISCLIRKAVGRTFTDYVTQIRMDRAREMLSDTTLSITDIALNTGFYDTSHFTNKFKKCCGVTPSSFRKKAREQARTNSQYII